ncbi:outer membrane protein assembly factor BamD [Bdellovibrionota bacterium]
MIKKSRIWSIITILLLLIACAEPVSISEEESARLAFEGAKGYQDSSRYELALEKFSYVKNKYPFTTYATMAELELANTYFLKGDYLESIAAYEAFRDLHPRNSRLAEVTYKIGLAYFELAPTSVDRDLTPIKQGIQVFEELIRRYPRSENIKDAKDKIREGRGMLARKELYIGDFYFKRGAFNAAALRYKSVLDRYSDAGHNAEAAYHLGEAYKKAENIEGAKKAFQIASQKHADSKWGEMAQQRLKEL